MTNICLQMLKGFISPLNRRIQIVELTNACLNMLNNWYAKYMTCLWSGYKKGVQSMHICGINLKSNISELSGIYVKHHTDFSSFFFKTSTIFRVGSEPVLMAEDCTTYPPTTRAPQTFNTLSLNNLFFWPRNVLC